MKIRIPIIGDVSIGEKPETIVKEIVKTIEEKSVSGSTVDLFTKKTGLSDEQRVSPKTLQANKGWVFKNTDVIAKEVSGIEFELYKTKLVGGEIIYDQLHQSPLLDALDKFNEFTSASDGFYTTEAHRLLTGDAFWYIEGKPPEIKAIYNLQPDKITLKFGKEKGSQRIIDHYEYVDTVNGKPVSKSYKPEEIIHFRIPNPSNPYRGLGKVEAAAEDIDLDTFGIQANRTLFMRGMISEFMLTTEKSLTAEQRKQLQAELQNAYGGVDNMNKTVIMSGGLEPKSVQMSNKDMQFNELSEWVRDKIMSIWGNTKASLGLDDEVNRAAGETMLLNWYRGTIRSEMKQITDTLNEFLVPRYGDSLMLGFCDPVKEDETSDVENTKKLIEAKVITPNEARARHGFDPLKNDEGADERGTGNAPAPTFGEDNLPKSLMYINRKTILRRSGIYKQKDDREAIKKAARPIAEKIVKSRKKAVEPQKIHSRLTNDQVWNYYEKQMGIVEAAEDILRTKIERFINKLVDKALDKVPAEIAQIQNKALFDTTDEVRAATLDFEPILMEVVRASGTDALNLVNDPKPYIPTDIRKQVHKSVLKFTESMVDTDREKIIDIIANGINDGLSVTDIKNSIVSEFSDYSKMQAERITRTEVLRSSNLAAVDAWEQSSVVVGKQWLTAPGADAECEQFEGDIIPLKGNFYDTSTFANGDPPIHPNCRCTILPVLEGERAFDTVKDRQIKELQAKAQDLEQQVDKRTKGYKEIEAKNLELEEYVKELEEYLET